MIMLMRCGLAIALAVCGLGLAHAKEPVAPPALQKEFDAFLKVFRAAVKADDSTAVAAMTQFPFMGDASIRTAAEFRDKVYNTDFQSKDRACIRRSKAIYSRDQMNNDNFSIICGDVNFVFTKTPKGFLLTEVGVND